MYLCFLTWSVLTKASPVPWVEFGISFYLFISILAGIIFEIADIRNGNTFDDLRIVVLEADMLSTLGKAEQSRQATATAKLQNARILKTNKLNCEY